MPAGSQVLRLSLGLKLAFPNFMMSSWVTSGAKGILVQTLKGHGRLPWREDKIEASSRLVLGKDFKSPDCLNCRHPEVLGFQRDHMVFLIAMLLSCNCRHLTKPRVRKAVEQRDHPATVYCRIKWYNCVGQQISKSQTALKGAWTFRASSNTWALVSRETLTHMHREPNTGVFIAALFVMLKPWELPTWSSTGKWMNKI